MYSVLFANVIYKYIACTECSCTESVRVQRVFVSIFTHTCQMGYSSTGTTVHYNSCGNIVDAAMPNK